MKKPDVVKHIRAAWLYRQTVQCPWLACSPDRKVYDSRSTPKHGLLEIKCPLKASFNDVACLNKVDGTIYLKKNHNYYYQIMGQMAITGLEWCDLILLLTTGECFIERICIDAQFVIGMQEKLDVFFYDSFLNKVTNIMN